MWYVELPGNKEGLLTFFREDPSQKQAVAFALIPGAFDQAKIVQAATALFVANSHESCVIFNGLPTSIGHCENWGAETISPMFSSKITKALFRFPAARCWKNTDMQVFLDHLRRFSDPWDQAKAGDEYRDRVDAGTQKPQVTEFGEQAFDEWFDLVTDPAHVDAERRQYQRPVMVHCACVSDIGSSKSRTQVLRSIRNNLLSTKSLWEGHPDKFADRNPPSNSDVLPRPMKGTYDQTIRIN